MNRTLQQQQAQLAYLSGQQAAAQRPAPPPPPAPGGAQGFCPACGAGGQTRGGFCTYCGKPVPA
jgi:hypothetical protein